MNNIAIRIYNGSLGRRTRVSSLTATAALFVTLAIGVSAAQAATPIYHGESSGNSNDAPSITMPVPAGTAAGDVMFAQVVTNCTHAGYPTRIIPPAGWAVARYDITDCRSNADVEQAIFWRVADADDTPSKSYSWNSYYWNRTANVPAPGGEVGTIVSYANVNHKYPIDDHGAWITTAASNQLSAPKVWASTDHDVLLVWYGYEGVNAPTTPLGMTQLAALNNGGSSPMLWSGVFDRPLIRGWTENSVGTSSGSGLSVGTAIALLPSDASPLAAAPSDPPTTGTTYYVANSGSDSNNGLSDLTPWRTISKINATSFEPGDRILFKAGDVWREELQPRSSGSPGNPIVFSKYGTGANPVISGNNVLSNLWTRCNSSTCGQGSDNIWYQDVGSTYSYILDIYVTDVSQACPGAACPPLNGDPGWGLMRAADLPSGRVKAPGPKVNPRATSGSAQISKMVPGSWLFNPGRARGAKKGLVAGRLYVWLGDGSSPAGHTLEATVRDHCIGGGSPTIAAYSSFVTFRNLTLTHSGDAIFYYGSTQQNSRYVTVEWDTISNLATQVDDGSYYNGIHADIGNTWLERHNQISYTGGHGNTVNNQVLDFTIVEYDDHSHCNHDCGDTKASDLAITRYNNIHDAELAPDASVGTPDQYGGLYEESYSNNGRVNYLGVSDSTYQAMGWEGYYNKIWNIDGAGNNSALQLDFGIGAGNLITQNTIYHNNGNGIYLGNSSTAPNGGGFIYNNIIDLTPVGSSVISDTAGSWVESYNELGRYDPSGTPAATFPDINGNPDFATGPPSLTLTSTSPCLSGGSTAYGLSGAMGAEPY